MWWIKLLLDQLSLFVQCFIRRNGVRGVPWVHVTSCHIVSHHAIPYHIMSYRITPCYIVSHHVISCHVMLYHMTSCHIVFISYHSCVFVDFKHSRFLHVCYRMAGVGSVILSSSFPSRNRRQRENRDCCMYVGREKERINKRISTKEIKRSSQKCSGRVFCPVEDEHALISACVRVGALHCFQRKI